MRYVVFPTALHFLTRDLRVKFLISPCHQKRAKLCLTKQAGIQTPILNQGQSNEIPLREGYYTGQSTIGIFLRNTGSMVLQEICKSFESFPFWLEQMKTFILGIVEVSAEYSRRDSWSRFGETSFSCFISRGQDTTTQIIKQVRQETNLEYYIRGHSEWCL